MEDPFMFVQREVEEDIQGIVVLFENWKLQRQEKIVSEVEFKCATQELRARINEIDYDVQDLKETIDIVQKDVVRYKISKQEIARREQFIADTTAMMLSLKAELQQSQEAQPSEFAGFKPRPSAWPMQSRKNLPPPSLVIDLAEPSPSSSLDSSLPNNGGDEPAPIELLDNNLKSTTTDTTEEEKPTSTSNNKIRIATESEEEFVINTPYFLSPRSSSQPLTPPLVTPRKAQLLAYLNTFGTVQPHDRGPVQDGSDSEFLEEISVESDLEEQALRLKKSYGYGFNPNLVLGRKSCLAMVLLFAAVAMLVYSFVI
jgi:hypothetical protein